MTTVVVAEKPSVARDLARVLGAGERGEGFFSGSGYTVTWAVGHLVALAEPDGMRPEWRAWRPDLLPMLPASWSLVVLPRTQEQFEVVSRLVNDPATRELVCATDAGREGELIFRYIYEAARCQKPVKRLWISSLTPEAIREGFQRIQEQKRYDALASAAKGRSRADWLVSAAVPGGWKVADTSQ